MKGIIYKMKRYIHFDRIKGIAESRKWIETPENIVHHGFMPFIHFESKSVKYSSQKERKVKYRDLAYCSHIDSYIYQLYAHRMMKFYNGKAISFGINRCVIAYRDIFPGKCNIHFAHEVIEFIRRKKDCFVIIGDFTRFFDKLDHKYLKEQCCEVLDTKKLPEDYYKVFRSITKYSYFELTDLMKLTGSKNFRDFNDLGKREIALPIEEFRKAKKRFLKKIEKITVFHKVLPLVHCLQTCICLSLIKL